MTEKRKCVRCLKSFPATTEHFFADKARVNGLRAACKACWTERTKEYGGAVTGNAQRHRKNLTLTVPTEVRERLELLAERSGISRSELVESLIMAAPIPKAKE